MASLRPDADASMDAYLALIEREREHRPAEAMLADEIRRLRLLVAPETEVDAGDGTYRTWAGG